MSVDQFFIQPIKSDDTAAAAAAGMGKYTLTSSTTYYVPLTHNYNRLASLHMTWDASIILTSVTLEVSNMPGDYATGVKWTSSTAGDFVALAPATGPQGVVVAGTGASIASGVIAVAGGNVGGGVFNLTDHGMARARLKIVVGGTGGVVKVSGCHKE